MKLRSLVSFGLAIACAVAIAGCGSQTKTASNAVVGTITASGSSALLPLAKAGADQFKKLHPDVSITVNAGGSGTGLKQVFDGTVQIGNSDVFAKEKLTPDQAKTLHDYKVAVVTMATVVNKDVAEKVKSLTKAQLQDIFTGKIKNWSAVGGPDEKIVLVTRPATSGTRALFTKFALQGKEEAENKALQTDDSGTLMQTISTTPGAIGYVAISYLGKAPNVKAVAIDGVAPTLANTYAGKYPVWGYEHMYTKGEAKGAVKAYIDYILSSKFNSTVESMGYGTVSKMKVSRED